MTFEFYEGQKDPWREQCVEYKTEKDPQMLMLCLNKTVDQLAMAYKVLIGMAMC